MRLIYSLFFRTMCIAITLSCTAPAMYGQDWEIMVVGSGAKPAIAVDASDVPHVAFMREDMPGFVKHAQMVGDAFVESLVGESYYYGPLDLAIGPDGNPAIAVHNHNVEDEDVYVRSADGMWLRMQVSHPGHDGWDNSITFDGIGRIHTSSVDPQNFGSNEGVEYAVYNFSAWDKQPIGSGPVPYMFSTSLALDSNDDPHIVYFSPGNDAAMYAVRKEGSWAIVPIEPDGGYFPSLALDSGDNPHIAFYKESGDEEGVIRYATKKGNAWTIQTVDMLSNVPIAFTGARHVTSIAIDHQDRPHVSYGDRKYVRYARLNAGNWEIQTVADESMSGVQLGAQTDLALDSRDNPHITYFSIETFSPLYGTILYAYKNITSSAGDVPETVSFRMYPNPASDIVTIATDDNTHGQHTLLAYAIDGRIVHQWVGTGALIPLSLSQLPSGIYFLRLDDAAVRKLVIEK